MCVSCFVTAQMTSAPAADVKARRNLRCRQDAEVDLMASVKGDERHRDDAMRKMHDTA